MKIAMFIVALASPTIVNTHPRLKGDGELRYPSEGPLTVAEDEAERLFENNLLDGEPEPAPTDDEEGDDESDGLDKLRVADLHLIVTKEGVALNDVTKKDEIIAAIRKHREAKSG